MLNQAQNGTQTTAQSGVGVRVGVYAVTSATPCVVTAGTSSPTSHGYATGDTVRLEGTAHADNLYTITVKSNTAYALNGTTSSTMSAQASAQGYSIDLGLLPQIQNLQDGVDNLNSASITAGACGLNNMLPYLYERVGKYRTYDYHYASTYGGSVLSPADWTAVTIASGASTIAQGCQDFLGLGSLSPQPCVANGDLLEVTCTLTFSQSNTPGGCAFYIQERIPGVIAGGVPGTYYAATQVATSPAGSLLTTTTMVGVLAPTSLSSASTFQFDIALVNIGPGNNTIGLYSTSMTLKHMRPN